MTDLSNIIPVNIEDEVSSSYIDYAMSVIIGRALPDVRDGLKPVHRRILYAMYEQSNTYNRAYKKSARIVGDVMGKYHPHGDAAIYDALVRMAQDFNMRMPLVDGQGNFGSIDGDPPAAQRYTEVRMTRASNDLLADIQKETVDFVPNYDDSTLEPHVLPSRIPNLLVNGSEGIAVGMATRIPPHNLVEVIDAAIHLIHNPHATTIDLMHFVKGPDFPTAGTIYGTKGIAEAYTTGKGVVHVRAKAEVETEDKTDRQRIVVTELPFQVNKARLLEKIAGLVREKRIEGIRDLRDESSREGMRMVIELKRDAIAEIVLNQLFKQTALQTSFGIIMLAIVAGRPQLLTLQEVLMHFVDFRRDVVTRRCRYELRQAEAREHILLGLQIALDHLDAVIALIRAAASPEEARDGLMTQFGLSERQAQAILDMRLQRLTGLERQKILEELAEVQAEITRLREILADEGKLLAVIVEELEAVKAQHADPRRTDIVPDAADFTLEDLIADEDMVVTVSNTGYVKRTPLSEYRSQRRGGKGRTGMTMKDDDFIEEVFVASTHTTLLVFTNFGRVFRMKVHEVPAGSPTTRGRPLVNLLGFDTEERSAAILPVDSFEDADSKYIVMATRSGTIKRTSLDAYAHITSRGLIAIKLRDDDELIRVRICADDDRIVLATRSGKSIQFPIAEVRPLGRDTMGVRGIEVTGKDACVGMEVVSGDGGTLLTITENGFGKRTSIDDYPLQHRGGKGVITIKTSPRNGKVVTVRQVTEDEEIVIITNLGRLIRMKVRDISVYGRNTQGVTLMRTERGEVVAAVALLAERDDEDGENDENGDGGEHGGDADGTAGTGGVPGVPGARASHAVASAVRDFADELIAEEDDEDPDDDEDDGDWDDEEADEDEEGDE
jgi:DNA gyrase subunit A